ncbi:MAG: DUF2974 domain-containing protein [Bifidobacteriaceae bacterium]|nr:DUF2974 domain-containing protein [Bifidobacteriaceae bacterium]
MTYLEDYVRNELRTFDQLPYNAIDAMAFSVLSYTNLPNNIPEFDSQKYLSTVPIYELLRAEDYNTMFSHGSEEESRLHLLLLLAQSPRYRGLRIGEYIQRFDHETEQQFAAMTFDLSNCIGVGEQGLICICYRGTDNTLVGWKEDFNMTYRYPVPSQVDAYEYAKSIVSKQTEDGKNPRAVICGHSKGGNMAYYAAMELLKHANDKVEDNNVFESLKQHIAVWYTKIRNQYTEKMPFEQRLVKVYSFDGPGFDESVLNTEEYHRMEEYAEKFVPQDSIIGLLYYPGKYRIIRADANGILQHLCENWIIEQSDFIYCDQLSKSAITMNEALNSFMLGLSQEERKKLVDEEYEVLRAGGYETFTDLINNWQVALPKIREASKHRDPQVTKFLSEMMSAISLAVVKGFSFTNILGK